MGTMRPNKYDVTTAYGLCQDFLPPDEALEESEGGLDLNVDRIADPRFDKEDSNLEDTASDVGNLENDYAESSNSAVLSTVVISGALCTVEDYVIMSQCAHNKAINLAAEGTVSVTDISQTQNITIVGRPDFVNNNFKIALYAKETQRYLCFNDHWKLVGMKELQDTCYFNEAIVHGYFVFRSVVDLQRRIGFTQRGRAVGPKKTVNDACYMFTKIPTDQFFLQHTHFSAPKTKSTTTKIPKTEYTHAPYSTHVGKGSGDGRTKTNHLKLQQHHHQKDDDTITYNQSGNSQGSGSGSGNGNVNKKIRKQRKGNKKRQQKQEIQQQTRGHSYNLNNPKNSTYLNSSRQNLVLSQDSINNNTSKKHNNKSSGNGNSNINKNHPPQNHQVRHHHNDPNKVARRQQHDQEQKTKMRQQHIRTDPSSTAITPSLTETMTKATAPVAATATYLTTTTEKSIHSTKPHLRHHNSSCWKEINPTTVWPTYAYSSSTLQDSHNTMTATVIVTKRKGRRRKPNKLHKKILQYQPNENADNSSRGTELEAESEPQSRLSQSYEEDLDYLSSSTDNAWMTNDLILSSSIKPTSASLPTWETWYPSSSTSYPNEESDYFSNASSDTSVTETNSHNKGLSTTTLQSSLYSVADYSFDKNTLTSQASLSLPTTQFSPENGLIDETITPTSTTTDLGTTTTNTSTYTQTTDFWTSSPRSDNTAAVMNNTHFAREMFNTYATPKLEFKQTTTQFSADEEAFLEDINSFSTLQNAENEENSTATYSLFSTKTQNMDESEEGGDLLSSSTFTDATADDTTLTDGFSTVKVTLNNELQQRESKAALPTTTFKNNCNFNSQGVNKSLTDCLLATQNTPIIANNHKHNKHSKANSSPTQQHSQHNYKYSKTEIIVKKATTLNTSPKNSENYTNFSRTVTTAKQTTPPNSSAAPRTPVPTSASSSLLSLEKSKALAPSTSLQYLNPADNTFITTFTAKNLSEFSAHLGSTSTSAAAFGVSTVLSTKPPVPYPLTTRKTLRKSTQRLLATPFHQLTTYVRNKAGDIDIDIDNIDNISIYPDVLDNDGNNDSDDSLTQVKPITNRLTIISGYLPTSATVTLPESIRIAKIKINRERKRMLRLRNFDNYA